ncbi:MAG: hypothetical protein IJW17_01240 [Lentisphaeria bacterium]|nr:hypothetical protein [Lentisphaeria bacterium]
MKEFEIQKYLRKGRILPVTPRPLPPDCRDFIVIPACDELEHFEAVCNSLTALEGVGKAAVLFVVNHPQGAEKQIIRNNELLIGKLSRTPFFCMAAPDLTQGVGEARKLGFDAVIAALPPEALEETVLYSLDADTVVEKEYLNSVRNVLLKSSAGAVAVGVSHQTGDTPEMEHAIREYERYLDRYVDRLRTVHSPYAFHTIGSAFAVRGDVYVRSGGMRLRQAGEDFYVLQAVAKSYGVTELTAKLVHPSPRFSHRVPFGTGRAVEQLLNGEPLNEIPDEPFLVLKEVLNCGHSGKADFYGELPAVARPFFEQLKFQENWARIVKNTPQSQLAVAFDRWFDGLQTLRFLHFLQENMP